MRILHSVCSLLKWKYLPSRTQSCLRKGETIHKRFLETPSISTLNPEPRKVLYTQRLLFGRSDKQLPSSMLVVNRDFHSQQGAMMTLNDTVDPGSVGSLTRENIKIMEKIEDEINTISKSVLGKLEDIEPVADDLRVILGACVRHLYSLRLSAPQIQEFLTKNKDLARHDAFIPITSFFYRNGLNGRRTCKVVSKFPQVLDLSKDQIRGKIEHLRDLGFINADILLIIEGLPEVLQVPTKTITRRISDLQLMFKSKDVVNLISKSPPLLIEDMAVIKAKFNYVFHVMGITQRQIMYSSLFKHSLNHIRQRHVFLVRAGFYKTWVKKGQLNPNPVLEDIVDISTRAFLQKYGKMPLSDYVAFCELFERESRDIEDMDFDGEESNDEDFDDEKTHKWKR